MNVYDVRLMDDWTACGMNWPPDLPDVYQFLRRDDVLRYLHATERSSAWIECDGKVSSELHNRLSFASVQNLPGILEHGVQVRMFARAEDLICNYKGIERMIENLEWSGQVRFGNLTASEWYFNGTQVGEWTAGRNMTYAELFGSSHMVGFDVPHVTNDMITRFMGVNLSLVPGVLGQATRNIGGINKVALNVGTGAAAGIPLLKGGKSDVENWYDIASAFLILFILISIVALYFYFKRKRTLRRRVGLPSSRDDPLERVPLGSERVELDNIERAEGYEMAKTRARSGSRKGKERASHSED